jgi:hypothetical protein
MNRTADLNAALSFVTGRANQQATLSGEPLDVQQSLLLTNLPSSTPVVWIPGPETPDPTLVARDVNYERLCALAKAAYLNDRKINPESLDWEFALAVFTFNRHPMWGVLHLAGVKMYRRPLWDQLFVIIAALFPVIAVILLAWNGPWTLFIWAGILCGTVAIMLLVYFASRQIEQWQLENHIERCRLASRNISWKAS